VMKPFLVTVAVWLFVPGDFSACGAKSRPSSAYNSVSIPLTATAERR
jgi:hypothetical protein